MKIVDANVLLYAVNQRAPHHASARRSLDTALSGDEAVGFAWVVILAFLRLSTNPSLFPQPLEFDEARRVMETWLAQPSAVVVQPTSRHLSLLHGLLEPFGTAANLVNDAHLAALAVEHGAEVLSFDGDFARFPGVRCQRPV